MPILRSMRAPCRFARITLVAALALAQAPLASAASISVARLNFDTNSESLRTAFEQFGTVTSATVITDSATGKSRGFGYVDMPDEQEARAAVAALDGIDIDGNTIVVKIAGSSGSAGAGTRPFNGQRTGGGYGSGASAPPPGGGGAGSQAGPDASTKSPTPAVVDAPAADDASNAAPDDAEEEAELDSSDADAATTDDDAALDASENPADEESVPDSDASADIDPVDSEESADVDAADSDASADVDDATAEESADEADDSSEADG